MPRTIPLVLGLGILLLIAGLATGRYQISLLATAALLAAAALLLTLAERRRR
jgi:hypothetical protein